MKEEELLALLRLQKTKSIGDILAKKLIAIVGSAEAVFKQKKNILRKINGIGNHAAHHLLDDSNRQLAKKELEYIQKNNISYLSFLDNEYPKYLQQCVDAPILFFKDGNINLSNKKIISIVGSRQMTNYGRDFCESLIKELSIYNPIIVSGFAYGIDICAHKAAIKNNLQTIGVLAHGLEYMYPKNHKRYIHQVNENGGFISEFFHNESPLRENFLRRNRIVAGISKATIIIESATKGGSLITADIANSYDRDVFAVPGRINDRMSQGCNDLIYNNKAYLLKSSEDIIKILNWDLTKSFSPKQTKLFLELTNDEQKIIDFLKEKEHQMIDVIALATNIPVFKLATILLQLELKNIIQPLPGKMFKLI